MRRISKVLKCGSSKVWVTAQMPFFVSLCETIREEVSDISKNCKLKTINFLWDNWNIISETTVSTTPHSSLLTTNSTSYVWGIDLSGSLQGAGGVGGLLTVVRDDGVYAPTYDGNGNVSEYIVLETGNSQLETGSVVTHYEYSPFGEIIVQSGDLADTFSFRFSTKPYCSILGKIEFELRIYDPDTGRWLNRDPIESIQRYLFVYNESLNYYDVLGLFEAGGPGSKYPGHGDMPGADRFPFNLEDEDPKTAPVPITGDPSRHFQKPEVTEPQVRDAIRNCNHEEFSRAMHRHQDTFSHSNKGYAWNPKKATKRAIFLGPVGFIISEAVSPQLGHGLDSIWGKIKKSKNTDADKNAYTQAEEATKYFVDEWDRNCCKCGDKWNVKSKGPCDK